MFTYVPPVNLLSCRYLQIRSQLGLTIQHCVELGFILRSTAGLLMERERTGRCSLAFFETHSTKSRPESSAWCPKAESSVNPGV